MKHANSNLNILKRNPYSKTLKLNNFLIDPFTINTLNFPISITTKNTNPYLTNLFYKKKSKISLYSNFIKKYKNSNNDISTTDSLNCKNGSGRINLCLNLNNEFINNNFTRKSKNKNNHHYNELIEKIKEKDSRIIKLQKDLLKSQELLNKLQKNKKKELSFTYNSINSIRSLDNLYDFFTITNEKEEEIIKNNYNKNIFNTNTFTNNKNKKIFKNSFSGFYNTNNMNEYQSSNNLITTNRVKFFTSLSNMCFPRGPRKYDSCVSLSKHEKRKINIYYKSNKKTNIESEKRNNIVKVGKYEEIKNKCIDLQKKANKVLNNYILLIEYINDINNKKKLRK